MSEQQNRDTLERLVEAFERSDLDAIFELFHDDYAEEYPQSGERIRGKQNALELYESYPGLPSLINHNYKISGDLGVSEMVLDYDSNRVYNCKIIEFEQGKIKRSREYYGDPFEAPEWRAQWVERM